MVIVLCKSLQRDVTNQVLAVVFLCVYKSLLQVGLTNFGYPTVMGNKRGLAQFVSAISPNAMLIRVMLPGAALGRPTLIGGGGEMI